MSIYVEEDAKLSYDTTRTGKERVMRAMSAWSGALSLVLVVIGSSPAMAQQGDEATQRASAHHERGIQLFQAGDFRQAAREFERAEGIAHSRTNLINLARCYQELGDNRNALRYIDRFLREPDLPPESRTRAEGIRQQLQTSGGGSGLAGPWALFGAGLAIALTGGILDIVAYVQSDTDHNANDPFGSTDEYDDWAEGAVALATAGDVLVAVGAAAAVAGLVWLLVARRSRSSRATSLRMFALSPTSEGGFMFGSQISF